MPAFHDFLVQAQLECPNTYGGTTVFVTWIPKDLKTHPGSLITNKVTGRSWKVARQYEQTIEEIANHDSWKVAG